MEKKRVGLLDEIRGFCILCMVVYHVMFDLKFIYNVNVPIFFEWWFFYVRDVFAGMFIFISGCVTRYSKNNLKRGAQCFFLGMLITFVTAFITPSLPVYFGILHMLGIAMLLFGLSERALDVLNPIIGIIISVAAFTASYNVRNGYLGFGDNYSVDLPAEVYNAGLLFPLGFAERGFSSGDFFPLLPWFFLFVAGSYIGIYFKRGNMPSSFYKSRIKPLAFAGKHTIWIYLLHQPIIFVLLNLIF